MKKYLLLPGFITAVALYSQSLMASVDVDAGIVHLRTDCTENNTAIANCFTDSEAVINWITNTRTPKPSSTSPLTIKLGPGRFGGIDIACAGMSDISFRGAGMSQSYIDSDVNQIHYGVNATDCHNISFQDMTINGIFTAVFWNGPGSSKWTNVEVTGGLYGWSETNCVTWPEITQHRWFNSRIISHGKTAYEAACSENWFFGSEIVNILEAGIHDAGVTAGRDSHSEIHIYGSVLRVIIPDGVTSGATAARASSDGEIHIHGTGIDVIGNALPNNITALRATSGGKVHANQSSYVLKTGSGGQITRISNTGGTAKAPYLWEPEILDLGNNYKSVDGADTTTEIVCNGATCVPHNLIYSATCTANGPWYDTDTKACR